ncbi:MAG: transcription elongation factor GreA [Oscillospiraceae bacterium]|nr:transcription elongation factor GreA [Oscillospiraceae bacterium]
MQKTYKMSKEHLDELKQELNWLKTVREHEVADQIKEARKFGDLSENSEYDEAKNEQARVYYRILEVENMVAHAEIIDHDHISTDRVNTGCHVVVQDAESGEESTYELVGSQEANPMEMRISDESPFGQAMLNKEVGQEFTLNVPAGKLKYKIIDIKA